jgi:hypothetical protein
MQRSEMYSNVCANMTWHAIIDASFNCVRHVLDSDTFLRSWQKFKKSVVIAVRFCSALFCHLLSLCYSLFVKLFCLNVCHICLWEYRSRDGAVGILTGYGLDAREIGVKVPVGSRIFSSPRRPDRIWGPPNLLSNGYEGLFPRE